MTFPVLEPGRDYSRGGEPPVSLRCSWCGMTFWRAARLVRFKRARFPTWRDYCSLRCRGKAERSGLSSKKRGNPMIREDR